MIQLAICVRQHGPQRQDTDRHHLHMDMARAAIDSNGASEPSDCADAASPVLATLDDIDAALADAAELGIAEVAENAYVLADVVGRSFGPPSPGPSGFNRPELSVVSW